MKEIRYIDIKEDVSKILTYNTLDGAEWNRAHYFPYDEYEVVKISDVLYGIMRDDGHIITKLDYDQAYVSWMFNTYTRPE